MQWRNDTHNDKLYPNGNKWMTKTECELVINECDQELEKNPNNESVLRKKIQACIHLKESGHFRMDIKLEIRAENIMDETYHQLINNFPTKKNLDEYSAFFESKINTEPIKIPKSTPENNKREYWPDPDKDFWTQVEELPPNPGQFLCKKCNAIKNENEDTCYNSWCDSKEFVQVKCPKCTRVDIAELIGGMALDPGGDPRTKDIMRGKTKFGYGCVLPDPEEMKAFHCNTCEFQW